jgi:Raf kinase inhibitor-like YbhB/YbcL family protein
MIRTAARNAVLGLCLTAFASGSAWAGQFTVSSPSVMEGATIGDKHLFAGFGCTGGNKSPALAWTDAPADAKSFAVTVYDPDAPTGSGWWHWVVFNIPADTTGLKEGAGDAKGALMPAGSVQSQTDFGQPGYGGPCPPVGDKPHRYIFTVHALKVAKLPLDATASGAMVGFFLGQNAIAKATVTGIYGR